MADKNPILLRIYPHPPVAYGRLNVHIINNGDSDLPIRLCHFRGISASIYTLDYYDLGTISPGQHIVFPIDPSKIEPYKFHLFYVQEKTASGTYEYVSNLVRVVVASSPKITVKAKDILTGKDIPLEGAYVNLYRLPWELLLYRKEEVEKDEEVRSVVKLIESKQDFFRRWFELIGR